MRVGLIGCGRWGKNIARVLDDLGELAGVHDPEADHDHRRLTLRQVLSLPAVAIATPPHTHWEVADRAIRAGVPSLFVEKPLATRSSDAHWLAKLAKVNHTRIMVGHVQLHAAGYQDFKRQPARAVLAHRFGWNPGYHGVTAWWDLAPHDVAVGVDLFGPRPRVSDVVMGDEWYDVELTWPEGSTMNLRGSRVSHSKYRRLVGGIEYDPTDDLEPEPLRVQLETWLAGGDNLDSAVEVVRILEAAERAANPKGVSQRMGAGRTTGRVPSVA